MRLVTWNINSVRLRIDSVLRFLAEEQPDILCLQETKCLNDQFPRKAFERAGYGHIAINGQKGYHGVATVARIPLGDEEALGFCDMGDCRHIAVTLPGGARLHNFYVPAGGDEPDREKNSKFGHKLDFIDEMTALFTKNRGEPRVVVGDLNIAPDENDVWSHQQLLRVVSHTQVETEAMKRLMQAGGFTDVARALHAPEDKLYSWWSYRSAHWSDSNRGRRLDHIWVSEPLRESALAGGVDAFQIHRSVRGWERPSDHAPVRLDIDL